MDYKKLSSDEKVNLMISMVDACTRICADGIRDRNKNISDKELMEKLRDRILYNKRRHREV
ncbi:hypothetical protein KAU30_01415 [Candidatus Bathyarchaeota archaeon]|nr:hypothetical protein [Candidatus Bathyarchaeota archaeon]